MKANPERDVSKDRQGIQVIARAAALLRALESSPMACRWVIWLVR